MVAIYVFSYLIIIGIVTTIIGELMDKYAILELWDMDVRYVIGLLWPIFIPILLGVILADFIVRLLTK